jgi:hypothetical protein
MPKKLKMQGKLCALMKMMYRNIRKLWYHMGYPTVDSYRLFHVPRCSPTIMEMIIALSIRTIVFVSSVLPLFVQIQNGWYSKQVAAEILQNGRIPIDNLNCNFSKAAKTNFYG